jgi:hypothetical protein
MVILRQYSYCMPTHSHTHTHTHPHTHTHTHTNSHTHTHLHTLTHTPPHTHTHTHLHTHSHTQSHTHTHTHTHTHSHTHTHTHTSRPLPQNWTHTLLLRTFPIYHTVDSPVFSVLKGFFEPFIMGLNKLSPVFVFTKCQKIALSFLIHKKFYFTTDGWKRLIKNKSSVQIFLHVL